jgi:glucosamine 6-phosphate synthetase-like amidotransferase/phosphosugar isomerase protein
MCGIAGFIGLSKDPKLTYNLATSLFKHLETRGMDAAGIWGVESGSTGSILYHKEPGKSSDFIETDFWKNVEKYNPDLLLMHARATSPGVGHAAVNKNNHPFVTENKEIGLVHNGNIYEFEFLKNRYEIKSDTDSEVLLRIIESSKEVDGDQIIEGLKNIWSVVVRGHMAVATGQRVGQGRRLYLTRNDKRPLWMADLTDLLGQMFFFSSTEIWYAAVKDLPKHRNILMSQKLTEIPVQEIWFFETKAEQPRMSPKQCKRFRVKINDFQPLPQGVAGKIPAAEVKVPVITAMDAHDNLISIKNPKVQKSKKVEPIKNLVPSKHPPYKNTSCEGNDDDYFLQSDTYQVNILLNHIEKIIENIRITVHNNVMSGMVTTDFYEEIVDMLQQTAYDLEGTEAIINT